MPEQYEKTAAGMDKRVPQDSEGAKLDRQLSWSGLIFPLPSFCMDVDLMDRVQKRLHHL